MPHFFSTLRFRITVLYVAVFGIILFTFSSVLYWVYQRNLAEDFDRALYNRALGIASSIQIDLLGQLSINQALIAESGKLFPFQAGNEYIEIRTPEGRSLARTTNLGALSLPFQTNSLDRLRTSEPIFATYKSYEVPDYLKQGDLRLLCLPLSNQGRLQLIVQLGVSTQVYDRSLARLRTALFFIGVPISLFLAGAAGWWLAGRSFLPINRIISAAQQLHAERLEARLPIPPADDELRRLSVTLNEMLDRLESAFRSQQRFVADASHELKTPITILKGEVDVLRQQPRSVDEYQGFLTSASEELQRLTQIIQNLLLLARADSGQPLKFNPGVRLDEVLLTVMERLQTFARQEQIKLSMRIDTPQGDSPEFSDEALTVRGEPELLMSLFFNLVHNAIKFSTAGQTVEIVVVADLAIPRVIIRDFGTGIRPEDLPYIFDRFRRAENPSRNDLEGTGLGLAIVRWIADAHEAKIDVDSKPAEGTRFTVSFRAPTSASQLPFV